MICPIWWADVTWSASPPRQFTDAGLRAVTGHVWQAENVLWLAMSWSEICHAHWSNRLSSTSSQTSDSVPLDAALSISHFLLNGFEVVMDIQSIGHKDPRRYLRQLIHRPVGADQSWALADRGSPFWSRCSWKQKTTSTSVQKELQFILWPRSSLNIRNVRPSDAKTPCRYAWLSTRKVRDEVLFLSL